MALVEVVVRIVVVIVIKVAVWVWRLCKKIFLLALQDCNKEDCDKDCFWRGGVLL